MNILGFYNYLSCDYIKFSNGHFYTAKNKWKNLKRAFSLSMKMRQNTTLPFIIHKIDMLTTFS